MRHSVGSSQLSFANHKSFVNAQANDRLAADERKLTQNSDELSRIVQIAKEEDARAKRGPKEAANLQARLYSKKQQEIDMLIADQFQIERGIQESRENTIIKPPLQFLSPLDESGESITQLNLLPS